MPHTLRTPNLILRPYRLRDAKDIAAVYADREMAASTKTWPHPVTEEFARWRIRRWLTVDPSQEFGFAIARGRRVVGTIGLSQRLGDTWSVGYGVNPSQAGKGVASEALRAVCDHAFRVRGVRAIEADVFQDNPASSRVALKNGFVFIGDIGPGWSTVLQGHFPRYGYRLTREAFARHAS